MQKYLKSTYFVESQHKEIIAYTKKNISKTDTKIEQIISLYYAVRDGFLYNPYHLILKAEAFKASFMLTKNYGNCVEKACLLAACARHIGVPSRFGFAIVRNHIGTEKIEALLKTNLLVFHGYNEFFLNGKWIKATPAFNKELCEKLGVAPLEFDGKTDSIFQEYDRKGGDFMEYVHEYGIFDDFPFEMFASEIRKHYGHLFDTINKDERLSWTA